MKFHAVQVKKNPACAACGSSRPEKIRGATAV
jgi:ribosomal protein L37E